MRFARSFGWVEAIYGASGHLHLAADRQPKDVANILGWVSATIASDKFDRISHANPASPRLLLWREQQRAIGERMVESGGEN